MGMTSLILIYNRPRSHYIIEKESPRKTCNLYKGQMRQGEIYKICVTTDILYTVQLIILPPSGDHSPRKRGINIYVTIGNVYNVATIPNNP